MPFTKCFNVCLWSKCSLHDIEVAGFVSSDLYKNGLLYNIMHCK